MTDKVNRNKTFTTNGCSNHSEGERQAEDYYATDPKALEMFYERFYDDGNKIADTVWETCVGGGHLADVLKNNGHKVMCSDIIDRGYPNTKMVDFLKLEPKLGGVSLDIITNPPYKYAQEFVEHCMKVVADKHQVIMFLKLTFLEGKKRLEMFKKYPPKYLYVHSSRIQCAINGEFEEYKNTSSAVAYGWYVWEKGFTGETIIRWL